MERLEVFADITCPFTHVGLRRFVAERARRGVPEPVLHVRAWPLELVNGTPFTGDALAPKIAALRDSVAPELFTGFRPDALPSTTIPLLADVAAAYRRSPDEGERRSLEVRDAIFERGSVPDPGESTEADLATVQADYDEGRARGVQGSPHFFTANGDFFCPSLDITHEGGGLQISFDAEGFSSFMDAVFGS